MYIGDIIDSYEQDLRAALSEKDSARITGFCLTAFSSTKR